MWVCVWLACSLPPVMRILLILPFLLPAIFLHGQDHWARRMGAWSNDAYNAIVMDAAGNSYVTGEFGGSIDLGSSTIISQGSLDIVVAKYDPSGQLLWTRTYGGNGLDRGIDIALGPSGELVVAGTYMGTVQFGNTTFTSAGETQDMFLLKMSGADGSLIWAKTGGGGDGVDQPNAVSIGSDGAVAVTGEFRGTATFDAGTITSLIDPETEEYSVDIFVLAYNAAGDPLWLKHGAAVKADRGMTVAHDPAGNVYVAGQFSDTLTFDQTHYNAMYSAIFIARFSPGGTEQWFRIFGGGTYNQVFDMQVRNGDRLMLVGDIQGTVIFLDTQPDLFTAVAPRSSFLVEVDLNGEFIRQKTWGSDHTVNTRSMAVHNDEVVVFGRFQCQFTGFSDLYGNGTWLATGQHDLYLARFDLDDLLFKDAQQFGGQGNKRPGGIVYSPDGAPIFCGAFVSLLVFPSAGAFSTFPPENFVLSPGVPAGYCTDPSYGTYTGLRGSALMDGFISRGYVEARQPYDMFTRSGTDCDRDQKFPFITYGPQGAFGADTISFCGQGTLSVRTHTAFDPDTAVKHTAPKLEFLWNNGTTGHTLWVTTSGWYDVTVTSAGGCWQHQDSAYVRLHPLPPEPLIHDNVVVNSGTLTPADINVCEPATPLLWVTGVVPGNTLQWVGPSVSVWNDSLLVTHSGVYHASAVTPFGCNMVNTVQVSIMPSGPLPPLDVAYEIAFPQDVNGDGTVQLCLGEPLQFETEVELLLNGLPVDMPHAVVLMKSCNGVPWTQADPELIVCSVPVAVEGWVNVTLDIMLTNAPCGIDTLFFYREDSVYVTIYPVTFPDASLSGPDLICPGDTASVLLECTNCSQVTWMGEGFLEVFGDSVWVSEPGIVMVTVEHIDPNGCSTTLTATHPIEWNALPLLEVEPPDGIICPNSTALIYTHHTGTDHQWYGPLGPMQVVNDSITTSQQGVYYLEMVDTLGCLVTSDQILITDYATPYLNILPHKLLCEEGATSTLQVVTTSTSSIQWSAPLSGNALQQVVSEPGIYTVSVNACDILTHLSVTIYGGNAVAAVEDPGPYALCSGQELLLQATPGMVLYYWLPGQIISEEFLVTEPGTYTLVAHDMHGCTDSLDIIVDAILAIPFTIGPDTLICPDGLATFHAPNTHSDPLWNGSEPGVLFTTPTEGMVTLTALDVNGCAFVDTAFVIHHPFTVPLEDATFTVCTGADAFLHVTGSGDIFWYGDPALTQLVSTGDAHAVIQAQASMVFHVVQQEDGCSSLPHLVHLVVIPLPDELEITGPDAGCIGSTVELTMAGDPTILYEWVTPMGTHTGSSLVISPAGPEHAGSYMISIVDQQCGGGAVVHMLEIYEPVPMDLGLDSTFCEGTLFTLAIPPGHADPLWSTGATTFSISITEPGPYHVEALDPNGCAVFGHIELEMIECEPGIPNVFTPNGDGSNDTFTLIGPFKNAPMSVYDRWGVIVWEGDLSNGGFDGRHYRSGGILPSGTYYYVLTVVRINNKSTDHTGHLQILH
jgi:gliding motility-associated-like protein